MNFSLTFLDRAAVRAQNLINHIFFPITGYLISFVVLILSRIKIMNHNEHKKMFKKILRDGRPLVICSNHLTFLDSILIQLAVSSITRYLAFFHTMSWNIPAKENLKGSVILRVIAFFGKCIPIDRQGNAEHLQKVLDKLKYVLMKGHVITIFPEGTRSRTGYVSLDNVTYGIGNIIKDVPGCRVLCCYLRGDHQDTYTKFPHKGDHIYLKMELIEPRTEAMGLRGARDLSMQVVNKMVDMEKDYFDNYKERKFERPVLSES